MSARGDGPAPGFSRADLHVHTTFSDGVASPEDVLNYYALHSGCGVIAVTDHDTLDGAFHARRHADEHPDLYGHLEIIVGEEVSTTDGHVIGLFLDKWIPPGLDAARTIEAIHSQGGLAVAAHPYTSWMRWAGLVGVGDLIKTLSFDAVETRNANFTEVFANRKAERNAGAKARVGNSDGHFLEAVARSYTDFPGRTARDLRRAILERTTVPGGGCYGPLTLCKYVCRQIGRRGTIWPRRRDFKRESAVGGLEIKVHRDSAAAPAIVTPTGRIDGRSMPELKETLKSLSEARRGLIVDLSQVVAIDSAGVTALVAGMKTARERGAGFCLASVPPHCAKALGAASLWKDFPRAPSVKEAGRRLGESPQGADPLAPEAEPVEASAGGAK